MSASKRKGTAFETEVVRYLQTTPVLAGVERRALAGNYDLGDISGIPGWVIEAKNVNTSHWAVWMDETEVERRNAHADFGLLVVRRRMKPIGQAYAVLPLSQAMRLIVDDLEAR